MLQFQTSEVVSDDKVDILDFKKKSRKTGIFTQNQFSTKSIFLYGCNSKTFLISCLVIFNILRNMSKSRIFA
ncbi:hypothetical protein FWK35_00011958, partial [Aphis craccivora]